MYMEQNEVFIVREPGIATIQASKNDGTPLKDFIITIIRNCDINNDSTIDILIKYI